MVRYIFSLDQSNFGSFLSNYSMEALASRFTWYHIDAPGQVGMVCSCDNMHADVVSLPFG